LASVIEVKTACICPALRWKQPSTLQRKAT
jgi:hypothetical protein